MPDFTVIPHVQGKVRYISGAFTNPDGVTQTKNARRFAIVAMILRRGGLETYNPVELYNEGWSYEDYLAYDLEWILLHRPILYMLRGWEASRGARQEHAWARRLCLEIEYEA